MSDKLIIDVIGVIKMSMQSFTRLVGIGSKSEDLHGARRTRWRTSSAVTQLTFCRTFLVSGYTFHSHQTKSSSGHRQIYYQGSECIFPLKKATSAVEGYKQLPTQMSRDTRHKPCMLESLH